MFGSKAEIPTVHLARSQSWSPDPTLAKHLEERLHDAQGLIVFIIVIGPSYQAKLQGLCLLFQVHCFTDSP